ncbi:nucleotidyltransferase family protein [Oricola indica]|uniref:nucleotidyltransferase family protein n=1 Tax=Oricola indica TaxID=2872591 RepID=UPI003CCC0B4E
MKISSAGGWLARLSDPAGPNGNHRPPPLPASDSRRLEALVDLAFRHNVRPIVVRNLKRQLGDDPAAMLAGEPPIRDRASEALLDYAEDHWLSDIARAALLADTATEIVGRITARGIPALPVKGPDFAIAVYGGIHARTFSDIDLLVRADAEDDLGAVLRELGFSAVTPSVRRASHAERGWIRADDYGGTTLVEVHTDLVHAPELRAAQTLTYDLFADPANGGVTPAARLVLAALHGATSHLFGRLQYVVDGLMIARMGVDGDELAERVGRSGAILAAATMLRLASEIYGCPESRELQEKLGPIPWGSLERRLITGGMVIAAKDKHRWRFLPQRRIYRRLLSTNSRTA